MPGGARVGDGAGGVRVGAHLPAAQDGGDTGFCRRRRGGRGSRPPSTTSTATCCAAWCTIPRRGAWAEWPGMRACSPPRMIWRNLRRRCWTADAPVLSPLMVEKMTTPQQPPTATVGARLRLGHRFAVLQQSRRFAAGGIVRAHRIHRHVAVDRSDDAGPTSSS